ncbi:MAG: SRPBCC family protein [Acidimicrobiales bacterium]
MDVKLKAKFEFPPSAVLAQVADLPGYPEWHGMVHGVEADGDGWLVDLGGQMGPFKHTKRVRLVRAEDAEPGHVRFVRAERDGKDHGGWELAATVDPSSGDGPCTLQFKLSYDGASPLASLLEPLLQAETHRSADRLRLRLAAGSS